MTAKSSPANTLPRVNCPMAKKAMQDAGFDQVVAAFVPGKNGQKRDFNDAFKDGELEPENLKHYLYRGELHLAKTPLEKALIRYRHTGQS